MASKTGKHEGRFAHEVEEAKHLDHFAYVILVVVGFIILASYSLSWAAAVLFVVCVVVAISASRMSSQCTKELQEKQNE